MFTEEEKKAIENKDKIRLNENLGNFIDENQVYAKDIYKLTLTLN